MAKTPSETRVKAPDADLSGHAIEAITDALPAEFNSESLGLAYKAKQVAILFGDLVADYDRLSRQLEVLLWRRLENVHNGGDLVNAVARCCGLSVVDDVMAGAQVLIRQTTHSDAYDDALVAFRRHAADHLIESGTPRITDHARDLVGTQCCAAHTVVKEASPTIGEAASYDVSRLGEPNGKDTLDEFYDFLVLREWFGTRLDMIQGGHFSTDPLTFLLPGANEFDGDTVLDPKIIDDVYLPGDRLLEQVTELVERMRIIRQNHLSGIIAAADKQLTAECAGDV